MQGDSEIFKDLLQNLQASFALYDVIAENDGVSDLRLVWANDVYLSVVKQRLETAVGMLFSELAPSDVRWIPFYGDIGLGKIESQIIEG
jgi:hypothetical protein